MQEIKNVYVDVYCIRDGMVHIFFVWGQGTRRKIIHFVCTQNFCGKEAMMFMGDHWIGMEPFMWNFQIQ